MKWEIAFKIVLTIVLLGVFLMPLIVGLRVVWTRQIDPYQTIVNWFQGATEPDFLATRNPDKLYQNGDTVGDVRGSGEQRGERFHFAQLVNTADLDQTKPFDYRLQKLRIVSIGSSIGMLAETTDTGSRALTAVLEDVTCEVVR